MGFVDDKVIATNLVQTIPDAGLYHFGVLMSSVHMAWMRRVCGRFGVGYRYSSTVVYNNFVWMEATESQRHEIEQSAQSILDARALYGSWTLAALYDPNTMPPELKAAHEENDRIVEELYGFTGLTELEMVTRLMQMNALLTQKNS